MPEEEKVVDDDITEEVAEEAVDDVEEDAEPSELSEVDRIAMEQGWNPDFDGDGKVDAATFLRRGEQIRKSEHNANRQLRREIKEMRRGIKQVEEYYKRQDEFRAKQVERTIAKLKKDRYAAVEEGDVDAVKALDEEIEQAQEEATPITPLDDDDTEDIIESTEFVDWHSGNQWYGADIEMSRYADGQAELPEFAGMPPERALRIITDRVKTAFPEKFERTSTAKPNKTPMVESTTPRKSKRLPTKADMTSEQREIMKSILGVSPDMTEKEYIKSLHEMGEI